MLTGKMGKRARLLEWLHQPLGGATFGALRTAEQHRADAGQAQADPTWERAEWHLTRGPGDAPDAGAKPLAPLATIVVELQLDPAQEAERRPQPARQDIIERQDELNAVAAVEARALLGDDVLCQVKRIDEGSVVVTFAVTLLGGTAPPNAVAGLDALAIFLRALLQSWLGWRETVATSVWHPGPALAPAAPPPEPQPERGDLQITKWLLGGVALLTGSLAAIKVSDADLLHARLNYPTLFSIAFGVVVGVTLVAVLWPAWQARRDVTRAVMTGLTAAAAVLAAAVLVIVLLTNKSLSSDIKPRIEASVSSKAGATHLVGTVETDGVPNRDALSVAVAGVRDDGSREILFSSKTGADRDGTAKMKVDLKPNTARFTALTIVAASSGGQATDRARNDCHARTSQVACLRLNVRPRATRPRLAAAWKVAKGHVPALAIHAQAAGLDRGDRLLLSVREPVPDGSTDKARRRVYGATWTADGDGIVDEQVDVPVRATKHRLCVILRDLSETPPELADGEHGYGPCGTRERGVAVLVGPPPV